VEKEPQQYAQKNHYIYFSVTSPSASNLIASLTAVVVPTTVTIPTEVSKWKKLSPNLFFTQTWNGAKPPKFNLGVKIESSFGFNYNQPYNLGLQIVYSNIPGAVAISQNFVITSCDPICNAPCGDNCDISANIGYIAGNLPAIKVIPNNCVCDQINGDSPEVFRTCPWHKVVLSKIQQIKPNGKVASTVSTFPYLQWGDQFTNIEGEDVNQLTGYIKVGSQKVGTQLTVSITNQVITTCIQIGSTCAGNWPSLGNDNLTVTYQVVTKEAFVIYDTDNLDSFLKKLLLVQIPMVSFLKLSLTIAQFQIIIFQFGLFLNLVSHSPIQFISMLPIKILMELMDIALPSNFKVDRHSSILPILVWSKTLKMELKHYVHH